jgi:hypothetical protein
MGKLLELEEKLSKYLEDAWINSNAVSHEMLH